MMVASPWGRPLLAISPFRELRLPAQERIWQSIDDIPDISVVSLVQSNCEYVPACT